MSLDRLSQALSWLRRHLETNAGIASGAVIQADRSQIALVSGAVTADVDRFEALIASAKISVVSGDRANAALALEQAIGLYSSSFLPGFCESDDILFRESCRLANAFENALLDSASVCESLGALSPAAMYAKRLLALRPTDHDTCARVLRLLRALGDDTGALRQFSEFKRRYKEQIGKPIPESLRQHADSIRIESSGETLSSQASGVSRRIPVTSDRDEFPGLPLTLTRYFGREDEIESLGVLIGSQDIRMLTLQGPGGCGKTRLAIELARRFDRSDPAFASELSRTRPPRRAIFVSLEAVVRAREIVPAIFMALGSQNRLREDSIPLRATVTMRLRDSADDVVLILDNAEHLAEEVETLHVLADLLGRLPSLTLLVTSRRPLKFPGEQVVLLDPLPVPNPQEPLHVIEDLMSYASVRLFVDRAKAAHAGFALTPSNQEAVARLCSRLEGLPLAIELCAAWSATRSPAELLRELDDRFQLLVARRPDVPPRHRGMYAAIDTSFVLLSPEQRQFLVALSVFRGGWYAGAAEAICRVEGHESVDAQTQIASEHLAQLQEHSLVLAENKRVVQPLDGEAKTRFRLLETVREFAEGQTHLLAKSNIPERHANYFLHLAETAEPFLNGSRQREWMDRLEVEHDNLRAAFAYYKSVSDSANGLRLAIAMRYFWNRRGYQTEACEYLAEFLDRFTAQSDTADSQRLEWEAQGRNALGRALQSRGNTQEALLQQQTALRLWESVGNKSGIAKSLWELGANARRRGDVPAAVEFLRRSLALADTAGDDLIAAAVLMDLGNVALDRKDLDQAKLLYEAALLRARRGDGIYLVTSTLNNLGEVARISGDLTSAAVYYEETLRVAGPLGDRLSGIVPRLNIAEIARLSGDLERAQALTRESLCFVRHLDEAFYAGQCLFASAILSASLKDWKRAAILCGAVSGLRNSMATGMSFADPDDEMQLVSTLRSEIGNLRYRLAFERGSEMRLDEAFGIALHEAA